MTCFSDYIDLFGVHGDRLSCGLDTNDCSNINVVTYFWVKVLIANRRLSVNDHFTGAQRWYRLLIHTNFASKPLYIPPLCRSNGGGLREQSVREPSSNISHQHIFYRKMEVREHFFCVIWREFYNFWDSLWYVFGKPYNFSVNEVALFLGNL